MRKVLLVTFALSLTAITSCARKPPTSQPTAIIQGVKVETIKTSTVEDYYEAVGTVRARNSSVIAARIMGNVVKLYVREGDRVRAGQTLIELENREAGTQIAKARAGVRESTDALDEVDRNMRAAESTQQAANANERLANTTFSRYRTLFERKSVSPQEFDEVRTKLEIAKAESERADRLLQATKAKRAQMLARIDQAQADVSSARIYAGYSRLVSPIEGIVVSKQVDVGTMATPGAPLITIENNASYQLEVAVEESQLSNIHLHDQAHVEIEAISNNDLTCFVVEIVPAADPSSRSYSVKLALPNIAGAQLRSGLYGKARFISGQRETLAIPQKAITQRGQLTGVFVVDQSGVARLRLVKTGKAFDDKIEVLSGLTDGDEIVVDGLSSIQDGSRVRDVHPVGSR
ncbi:MAG TPA: efflux RND transporter periplasmic adaptor subunit [Pyrinomonadaceae bacterium]|nr:efflux RND transporter periplasmic adaptor subunit [Pyrinomonadaceae bacterium]